MSNTAGIYKIALRSTDKCYVGSSANLERRKTYHLYHLRKGDHHSPYLQNAWNVYGEEAFEFVVLETHSALTLQDLKETLKHSEQWWMDRLGSCYNVLPAAYSHAGRKRSAETRAKLSAAAKGRVTSEATKEKIRQANFGKVWDAETVAKRAASNTGKKRTAESKARISTSMKLVPGRVKTVEEKAKIRASMKALRQRQREEKLVTTV